MVISQPPGNNHIIIASPTPPSIALNASRDTLCSTSMYYNIRVIIEMVLLSIFFTRISDPRRDHQQIVLYSFCQPMRLLFIQRLKYYQIFRMKIWARWPYIHLSVVFPSRMPAGPHFVTQPILLSENIPDIWHKSSTNTRRSDQIETIKTIMQTTRPRITWKVLPMAQVAIFKEIFDQCEKI